MHLLQRLAITLILALSAWGSTAAIVNPIIFVTQVPIPEDFCTINSTFCNHLGDVSSSGRGGDLWIRYPDGSLKNLTATAGFGSSGLQNDKAIQVRDPAIDWTGKKVIFSMVVGAPQQYQINTYLWQLYELTGFGQGETPSIRKIPGQPAYNNTQPSYSTDGQILFVSDQPRGGLTHLYPQLDEYEEAPSNTGVWKLDPGTGKQVMLTHSPSGDFSPFVDSFGRVIFTRWDHLQQDQQAANDRNGGTYYGTFNYASEAKDALVIPGRREVFPEPLAFDLVSLAGTNLTGHSFNHFFPWQMTEDGTELEIVNHVGRHELGGSFVDAVFTDDPELTYLTNDANPNKIRNLFHLSQDLLKTDRFIGINGPEFGTHASGQIVGLNGAGQGGNADDMRIDYLTPASTATETPDGDAPPPDHSGHYRDAVFLSSGELLAAHTFETRADDDEGSFSDDWQHRYPKSRYDFRIRSLSLNANGQWTPGEPLTSGIKKDVTYFSPDVLVHHSGNLWELQPIEVKPRSIPPRWKPRLDGPESQVLQEVGVSETSLRQFLANNGLAMTVVRNITRRDHSDRQQPFNLEVAGGGARTVTARGKIYGVANFQLFQANQVRGLTGCCSSEPVPGRRVLAQPLADLPFTPPEFLANQPGSVKVAKDGSVAALVPTQRALTWQLTDAGGNSVVKERNWVSLQPGEIRTCPACHAPNKSDQIGQPSPVNKPEALRQMLVYLKDKGLVIGSTSAFATSSVSAANKTYDGTATATITACTLTGVAAGDVVTCSASAASFSDANAGASKNVTATGITLAGANANKYTLASTSATTTASIAKAPATITLGNLSRTFTGTPLSPTATTNPAGLSVNLTGAPQTNAGSYPVTATVSNPNYTGSATGTFVIAKAAQPALNLIATPTTIASGGTGATLAVAGGIGGSVTYAATPSAGVTCAISGNTLKATGSAGTCSVRASHPGTANYLPATSNTVIVTVTPAVNVAPVAVNDSLTLRVTGTTPVNVSAPGILANDTDANRDALKVAGATPRTITLASSGGKVTLQANGSFTYTPPSASFSGTRSFTYQVTDSKLTSNTATATLTLTR